MPVRSCGPSHCSRWLSIAIRLPFDSGVSERNCSTNVTCLGLRGLAAAPAAALAAASRSVRCRLRARVPVSSSQYLRFSSSLCRLRSSALYASWLRGSPVAAWTRRPSRHSYPSGGLPTGAISHFFPTSSFGHASLPNTNSGERALKRARVEDMAAAQEAMAAASTYLYAGDTPIGEELFRQAARLNTRRAQYQPSFYTDPYQKDASTVSTARRTCGCSRRNEIWRTHRVMSSRRKRHRSRKRKPGELPKAAPRPNVLPESPRLA